ncbi:MAG TPA: hypothetical protein VLJ62_06850 [Burkholderiaceae bacterium]|nr:hypothetical protein [Burkholderiaceae bacterium]
MKYTIRSITLAVTLALGLAACGGSDDPAPPETGGGSPPPVIVNPPPAATFTLTLATDKVVLMQGGTASVRATITRSAGFDAAVTIELSGLPAGVSAAPVVVGAGASKVDIVLAATTAAPHSLPTTGSAEGRAAGQSASKPLTVTVRGLAGDVDTSFASGGTVITPVDIGEDYANAVAVQNDGKLLVAGSSATVQGTKVSLLRYRRDGGLDASFGNGGKVLTPLGARGNDSASAIAVQADGKIVVAGSSDQGGTAGLDFALLRYNADGSLDATFGNGGIVLTDLGSATDRAWALLLTADGKIVLGGETNTGSTAGGVDFALARYLGNGTLDTGFGNGGKVVTALKSATGTDIVRALAVQTVAGKTRIVAAGGEGDFIAARYTDAGTLDAGFGVNGKVVGLFNATIGSARAIAVLPGGEAVLAGHIGHNFAAVQLTADGQLDNRFGAAHDGRFTMAVSTTNWDEATALVRQSDGKLILGGWVFSGNSSAGDFAAVRLNGDGSIDAGFGNAGVTIKPMAAATKNDLAHAAALQADERIPSVRAIVAGEAGGSNNDVALTRLWL